MSVVHVDSNITKVPLSNLLKIDKIGIFELNVTFNFYLTNGISTLLSFSLNNSNDVVEKTVFETNVTDFMDIQEFININTTPYNFSLYIKSSNNADIVINNLNIFVKKM